MAPVLRFDSAGHAPHEVKQLDLGSRRLLLVLGQAERLAERHDALSNHALTCRDVEVAGCGSAPAILPWHVVAAHRYGHREGEGRAQILGQELIHHRAARCDFHGLISGQDVGVLGVRC